MHLVRRSSRNSGPGSGFQSYDDYGDSYVDQSRGGGKGGGGKGGPVLSHPTPSRPRGEDAGAQVGSSPPLPHISKSVSGNSVALTAEAQDEALNTPPKRRSSPNSLGRSNADTRHSPPPSSTNHKGRSPQRAPSPTLSDSTTTSVHRLSPPPQPSPTFPETSSTAVINEPTNVRFITPIFPQPLPLTSG